jgi:hypothetical protein
MVERPVAERDKERERERVVAAGLKYFTLSQTDDYRLMASSMG